MGKTLKGIQAGPFILDPSVKGWMIWGGIIAGLFVLYLAAEYNNTQAQKLQQTRSIARAAQPFRAVCTLPYLRGESYYSADFIPFIMVVV